MYIILRGCLTKLLFMLFEIYQLKQKKNLFNLLYKNNDQKMAG